MQIHLAAWGQNGGGSAAGISGISHARVLFPVRYPYVLESYHYMNDKIVDAARTDSIKFFLDSGAFSMFTQGVEVNLKGYAEFIHEHQDIIHAASNLDAIGQGQEQLSYDRQKQLEAMGAMVKPVHHVRDSDSWLQRYLGEGYDYIFLGGMVPESNPVLLGWLDHVWHKYLTNPDGTARVKVHGFGLTSLDLMFRYPWFSVDSTSWVMAASFGSVFLDMPQRDGTIKDYKIDFSTSSSKRYDINSWHWTSLSEPERTVVLERLEQLEAERPKHPELEAELEAFMGCKQGFNPEALGKSYGWRRYANVEYFRRAMNRKVDHFIQTQPTLF
jgi:hypothetical protein